jgi:hypothetical protein
VVEKHDFRLVLANQMFDFFKFASADEESRVGVLQSTSNKCCRTGAG